LSGGAQTTDSVPFYLPLIDHKPSPTLPGI
jgi:hypothetical protein